LSGLTGSASVGTAGEASGMKASDNLVSFIANHEGYSATPYRGIDYQNETIGYGHVIKSGENLDNLSQSDALQLLKSDIKPCVDSVNREFAGVKLTQPQFDSLVSFSYALGTNVWKNVPTLTSDIKAGASAETLKQDFAACDHCNGVEVKGLLNRRMDEWKMFVSGEYE
ncbi:MAG: lysozyme, partial [Clostridia bacterium]|nr:lysozyme [Clostridia bacterium]